VVSGSIVQSRHGRTTPLVRRLHPLVKLNSKVSEISEMISFRFLLECLSF